MLGLLIPTGGNAFLGENGAALRRLTLGLGWNRGGRDIDLDASAFLVGGNGKVSSDEDFIFYNARRSRCGSVEHHGDSKDGGSGTDDERISLHLDRVPSSVHKVTVTVTIHNEPGQHFMFRDLVSAYVRVVNDDTGTEILRYQLDHRFEKETAVIFADIYRHQSGWKFKAVGQGFSGGLGALCRHFGVVVNG